MSLYYDNQLINYTISVVFMCICHFHVIIIMSLYLLFLLMIKLQFFIDNILRTCSPWTRSILCMTGIFSERSSLLIDLFIHFPTNLSPHTSVILLYHIQNELVTVLTPFSTPIENGHYQSIIVLICYDNKICYHNNQLTYYNMLS